MLSVLNSAMPLHDNVSDPVLAPAPTRGGAKFLGPGLLGHAHNWEDGNCFL